MPGHLPGLLAQLHGELLVAPPDLELGVGLVDEQAVLDHVARAPGRRRRAARRRPGGRPAAPGTRPPRRPPGAPTWLQATLVPTLPASAGGRTRPGSLGGAGRARPAGLAPGLLRRSGEGDQGPGVDGPGLRAARVLLPRDRPQPARGRPVPGPGRGLRRRRRRGARPAPRSCSRPTARPPRSSRRPAAAARVVVDAVCPLVTKVHHELKVRAGKGYTVLYVGHEGHEEAVGTMAVAPESVRLVRIEADVDEAAAAVAAGHPGGLAGPDHPQPRRVVRHHGPRPGALPRSVDAQPLGPVLRHHQPPGGAEGHRRPRRRRRRHRLGELLEHPGPREGGPRRRDVRGSCASTRRPSSPTICRARSGVTAGASAPDELVDAVVARLAPPTGVEEVHVTDEDEYFPPPPELRDLLRGLAAALAAGAGGAGPARCRPPGRTGPDVPRALAATATSRPPTSWPAWRDDRPPRTATRRRIDAPTPRAAAGDQPGAGSWPPRCWARRSTAIDSTVVGIALPAIGHNFALPVSSLQWVVTRLPAGAGRPAAGGGRRSATASAAGGSSSSAWCGSRWRRWSARWPPTPASSSRACPAGRRWGAAHAGVAGHPAGLVRPRRPGPRHRGLVGPRRRGHRHRPLPRAGSSSAPCRGASSSSSTCPLAVVVVADGRAATSPRRATRLRHRPRRRARGASSSPSAWSACAGGLIEAPGHGWTSAPVLGAAGRAAAALLVAFVVAEAARALPHAAPGHLPLPAVHAPPTP